MPISPVTFDSFDSKFSEKFGGIFPKDSPLTEKILPALDELTFVLLQSNQSQPTQPPFDQSIYRYRLATTMSSSPKTSSSRNGAANALAAAAASSAGQNNDSGQNNGSRSALQRRSIRSDLPEEYALFTIDLLVKVERPLAKHVDKVIPIEPLRKVFDCLGGLDKILVTSYNFSSHRAKLRREIAAFRVLINCNVDRAPATISERCAAILAEAAGPDGGAGDMDLRSYVEQRLSPLLEELERTLANAEEFPEFVSPDIERLRQAHVRFLKSHQEDCEHRMAEAEAVQQSRARWIEDQRRALADDEEAPEIVSPPSTRVRQPKESVEESWCHDDFHRRMDAIDAVHQRQAREIAEIEEKRRARQEAEAEEQARLDAQREQERDDLIATLVASVAELRAENTELRADLDSVKRELAEGRARGGGGGREE